MNNPFLCEDCENDIGPLITDDGKWVCERCLHMRKLKRDYYLSNA